MSIFNKTIPILNGTTSISINLDNTSSGLHSMNIAVSLVCCVIIFPCILAFLNHYLGWNLQRTIPVNTNVEIISVDLERPPIIDMKYICIMDTSSIKQDDIPKLTCNEIQAHIVSDNYTCVVENVSIRY